MNFLKNKSIANLLKNGMPKMATTLNNWEIPLTILVITQDIIEGELVENKKTVDFIGVWQPLKDEQLELKPEGQRQWEWIWIHAKASELNLKTADKVLFNEKKYKVVEKKDYSLNGYIEYQLIQDYKDTTNE